MTVKEFIEKLQEMPQDLLVVDWEVIMQKVAILKKNIMMATMLILNVLS